MSSGPRQCLLARSPEELEELVCGLGGRPFHARIARRELLCNGVLDYREMSALPQDLRRALAEEVPLLASVERRRARSSDGTTKLLLEFPARDTQNDSALTVETVYIPSRAAGGGPGATLCVSSQAGCPVGCPFCASGLGGLARNLQTAEILEQYARGVALGPLRRSVVMGIGEPLLNYENLQAALAVVRAEVGLGARKLTVSTVGFPERLRHVARSNPGFQLAISLHTPDDDQRDELVPAMRGTPIEEVLDAGDDWFTVTGREVTYEYVLLGGANDSKGHATRLGERLRSRRATVNLIPYNPTEELPFKRPDPEAVEEFRRTLQEAGVVATVRWSRGLDKAAACGQLRWKLAAADRPQKRQV